MTPRYDGHFLPRQESKFSGRQLALQPKPSCGRLWVAIRHRGDCNRRRADLELLGIGNVTFLACNWNARTCPRLLHGQDDPEDAPAAVKLFRPDPSPGKITGVGVMKWIRQVLAQHGLGDKNIAGAVTDAGADVSTGVRREFPRER